MDVSIHLIHDEDDWLINSIKKQFFCDAIDVSIHLITAEDDWFINSIKIQYFFCDAKYS